MSHDIAVYAGYVTDNKELMECSSGGIATALSRHVIKQGGYVVGVSYSEDFYSVRYEIVNDEAGLERLKGSKYVDAEKGNIYSATKELLEAGNTVLFFGVPCVVAALKLFLKEDYENLITCELICEGPTTAEVHRNYIEYLEKKFHSKVTEFTVRRKKTAWIPKYLYAKFENGKVFEKNFRRTEYNYAFKVYGKKSCYDCKFKGDNRTGDLTLGDFWGATEQDAFWNAKGVSAIFAHTEKGQQLLLDTEGIALFPSDFARAAKENPMLTKSRKLRPERAKFEELFEKKGLIAASKQSMAPKDRLIFEVKKAMPESVENIVKKIL